MLARFETPAPVGKTIAPLQKHQPREDHKEENKRKMTTRESGGKVRRTRLIVGAPAASSLMKGMNCPSTWACGCSRKMQNRMLQAKRRDSQAGRQAGAGERRGHILAEPTPAQARGCTLHSLVDRRTGGTSCANWASNAKAGVGGGCEHRTRRSGTAPGSRRCRPMRLLACRGGRGQSSSR